MFVVELGAGWYAQSTGLMADALTCSPTPRLRWPACGLWAAPLQYCWHPRYQRLAAGGPAQGVLVEVARRFVCGGARRRLDARHRPAGLLCQRRAWPCWRTARASAHARPWIFPPTMLANMG